MAEETLATGLYETLLTRALEHAISGVPDDLVDIRNADPAEVHVALGRHVARLVERAVQAVPEADRAQRGVELANAIARLCGSDGFLEDEVADGARELLEVRPRLVGAGRPRPEIPLSTNAILVNGRDEPRVGHELAREIASADAVDVIVAFVFWRGVRLVRDALAALVERGGRVRVITTTYAGATEQRALDALVDLGAEVRVSYDTGATRLHAKAWLLERNTGLSTAYIGSSNLSHSAQVDGLEWNVRLSQAESPLLLDRFRTVFESYWASDHFEPYEPHTFARALQQTAGRDPDDVESVSPIHIHPYPHQRRILDDLEAERERHGRYRNLVVAATGTGKTVVAALDYARLRQTLAAEGRRDASLLFVAHRGEILRQSRSTFRHVLANGAFGELFVGGARPDAWRHVFASVQSLSRVDLDRIPPDHFDVVIVDEFHHAAAATYRRLLEHLQPRVLLGLTATPERADGEPILHWFDDRIASELRLWDAIDGGMLCPFHYFGVHDDVDLAGLEWRRGGYDEAALDNVYTGNDARAAKIVQAVRDIVDDPRSMRALGFCVSVAHAHYMARFFVSRGFRAAALDATTDQEQRRAVLEALEAGELQALFAVDLLNEGVDLPHVDTVLFLRPTESATVFLQQLGRGLRRVDGKPCLTVLDFIGNQHRRFRFDLRYRALTGATRGELIRHAEEGFPFLPSGCHLTLDRVASRIVLDNIRRQLQRPRRELVADLEELVARGGDVSLERFLRETQTELADLYRDGGSASGWTALRRAAGLPTAAPGPAEGDIARAIGRMLHVSDVERLDAWREWLSAPGPPDPEALDVRQQRLLGMLLANVHPRRDRSADAAAALDRLWRHPALLEELWELLDILEEAAHEVTWPIELPAAPDVPLHVHARYTRDEILAAFGHGLMGERTEWREGVRYEKAARTDLFAFTLRKAEREFSPTTMYRDYAISRELIHWESQSTTTQRSPMGQRYINHVERGTSIVLFARSTKDDRAFTCLGPATYVRHEGERPIAFVWRLHYPLTEELFAIARADAA